MKDLERLKIAGSDEDRALLQEAATGGIPESLRRDVRLAVEQRLSPRGRRPAGVRLLLAFAGTVVGGTALALGFTVIRDRLSAPAELIAPDARPPSPQQLQPPPATELPENAPAPRAPTRRPPAPVSRPALPSLGQPGLRTPPSEWALTEPPPPGPTPASAGRLIITHQGRRPVAITLAGPRVSGDVRGADVTLEVQGPRITGKVAGETFSLLIQGSEAIGSIAGQDVAFVLVPTRDGHLVRGSLPGLSARIELGGNRLSWYPGCEAPLVLTAPNTYEGGCAGGQSRVIIPEPWQRLPVFPRLILMALFLVEREPGLPDRPRTLFGEPDWPSR